MAKIVVNTTFDANVSIGGQTVLGGVLNSGIAASNILTLGPGNVIQYRSSPQLRSDIGAEAVSNKSTSTSLGTSNTLYPTQNAVKTYVDNATTLQGILNKENTATKNLNLLDTYLANYSSNYVGNNLGAVHTIMNPISWGNWNASVTGAIYIAHSTQSLHSYGNLTMGISFHNALAKPAYAVIQIYSVQNNVRGHVYNPDGISGINLIRRFTAPDGRHIIVIGDENTTWTYPRINVDWVTLGGPHTSAISQLEAGEWQAGLLTDFTGYTLLTPPASMDLRQILDNTSLAFDNVLDQNNVITQSIGKSSTNYCGSSVFGSVNMVFNPTEYGCDESAKVGVYYITHPNWANVSSLRPGSMRITYMSRSNIATIDLTFWSTDNNSRKAVISNPHGIPGIETIRLFTHDGRVYLMIGEVDTVWNYPRFYVEWISSGSTIANFYRDWESDILDNLSGYTQSGNPFIVSKYLDSGSMNLETVLTLGNVTGNNQKIDFVGNSTIIEAGNIPRTNTSRIDLFTGSGHSSGFRFYVRNIEGTSINALTLDNTGVYVNPLGGSGNKMVTVVNTGRLTTMDIPSVAMTVGGNALNVSGSPVSPSGTLALAWGGNSNQYVNGQGNLVTFPSIPQGTVTSVGMTVGGNALNVTPASISSSGTFALTWGGNTNQYVRGDGSLATLPTGTGSVTSVDMTVPTGLTISGNPITNSGTLVLGYATGYTIPTTAKQTNWDTAYGWGDHSGLYAPVGRTLTAGNGLTGGGNLSANRTFTLGTPSNITLSSTNSVTGSSHTHAFVPGGTTSQYIRGDGSLATFPSIPAVNNGTLTLGTGTGLSGSATFTANQSGNSSFTVGIASGYTLPTNAQVSNWNTAYGWGNHAGAGYESASNKSNDPNLGTSSSLYPTQGAVKSYVDSMISTPTLDDVVSAGYDTGQKVKVGGFAASIKIVDNNYTVVSTDYTVLVDCSNNNVNITLPTSPPNVDIGQIFVIRRIDTNQSNNLLILTSGGTTIEGSSSTALIGGEVHTLQYLDSVYYIINRF